MDIDPFPLEWEDDDHHIIESLIRQHEHAPKELRCRSFQVNGEEWLSWTMLEHLYRKTPSQYPTQARGLFTRRQPNGRYTVQVRGYDKFFNVNETAKTQVNPIFLLLQPLLTLFPLSLHSGLPWNKIPMDPIPSPPKKTDALCLSQLSRPRSWLSLQNI
jgi:hypothetical protein